MPASNLFPIHGVALPSPRRPQPRSRWLPILRQILLIGLPLLLRFLRESQRHSPNTKPPQRSGSRSKPQRSATPQRGKSQRSSSPPGRHASERASKTKPAPTSRQSRGTRSPIAALAAERAQDVLVTDRGTIVKVLPDDNEGSRHQRFLVEIPGTDLTVKISHNIDLAPRVPATEGDELIFRGDYAWNDLGGYVHWTHHDPKQWREGGWIEHHGQRYA